MPRFPPGATSRATVAASSARRAGRCRRWCVVGLCERARGFPKRNGAGAKGNTPKRRLVGLTVGQERCTAWRRGPQVRPIVARIACGGVPDLWLVAVPGASGSAFVVDGTSGEGERFTIGVTTGSARSRQDGMSTVGDGEAAGAGTVAMARGARGRGTRGEMLVPRRVRLADPPGPNP